MIRTRITARPSRRCTTCLASSAIASATTASTWSERFALSMRPPARRRSSAADLGRSRGLPIIGGASGAIPGTVPHRQRRLDYWSGRRGGASALGTAGSRSSSSTRSGPASAPRTGGTTRRRRRARRPRRAAADAPPRARGDGRGRGVSGPRSASSGDQRRPLRGRHQSPSPRPLPSQPHAVAGRGIGEGGRPRDGRSPPLSRPASSRRRGPRTGPSRRPARRAGAAPAAVPRSGSCGPRSR